MRIALLLASLVLLAPTSSAHAKNQKTSPVVTGNGSARPSSHQPPPSDDKGPTYCLAYETSCGSGGIAKAELTSIPYNHDQIPVARLIASKSATGSTALDKNRQTQHPLLFYKQISFLNVQAGPYWSVNVGYLPSGSTTLTNIQFAPPNSMLPMQPSGPYYPLQAGPNKYQWIIPVDGNGVTGIPSGVEIATLKFTQAGDSSTCTIYSSQITALVIDKKFPIDFCFGQAFPCTQGCPPP
ncbi:MAG TPA: hypothetical protein V6C76_14835 [Drouetiella sp.]